MNFYLINGFSMETANSVAFSEQENDKKTQSWLDFQLLERNRQISAKHTVWSIYQCLPEERKFIPMYCE